MKRRVFAWSLAPLAVVGALAFSFASGPDAEAAPPKKPAGAAREPVTVNSLAVALDGFRWGMAPAEVVKAHNQVQGIFDRDFNPILMKMQPGIDMQNKEAERENKKIAFEHSLLKFERTPVGLDTSGLNGEYSYMNKESLHQVERDGKKRYFFYIGELPGARLWKIYDEVPLGGALGASFQEAVQKAAAKFGAAGTPMPAAPEKGYPLPYVAWQDATTQLRLVDRSSERLIGWVVEDKSLVSALPQLRAKKQEDPLAMDPAIAAITSSGLSDPNSHKTADAGAPVGKKKR